MRKMKKNKEKKKELNISSLETKMDFFLQILLWLTLYEETSTFQREVLLHFGMAVFLFFFSIFFGLELTQMVGIGWLGCSKNMRKRDLSSSLKCERKREFFFAFFFFFSRQGGERFLAFPLS
jgi:hypothetical protein